MAIKCPFCDETSAEIVTEDFHTGQYGVSGEIVVKFVTYYKCKSIPCQHSWLPALQERKIDAAIKRETNDPLTLKQLWDKYNHPLVVEIEVINTAGEHTFIEGYREEDPEGGCMATGIPGCVFGWTLQPDSPDLKYWWNSPTGPEGADLSEWRLVKTYGDNFYVRALKECGDLIAGKIYRGVRLKEGYHSVLIIAEKGRRAWYSKDSLEILQPNQVRFCLRCQSDPETKPKFWDSIQLWFKALFKPLVIRQIIDGVLYDTSQARPIASYSHRESTWDEWGVLYRKNSDQSFFLHTNSRGNPELRPMSTEDTKKWLEQHNLVDEYLEVFGVTKEVK